MLCPSCNKFAALDTSAEPEVEVEVESVMATRIGVDPNGEPIEVEEEDNAEYTVSGSVRIVLASECCGDELKEMTFDVDAYGDMERADGCNCDLTELLVDVESAELTDRYEQFTHRVLKSGETKKTPVKPRYQKRYFGAEVKFNVHCACGKTSDSVSMADEVQASGMDEL